MTNATYAIYEDGSFGIVDENIVSSGEDDCSSANEVISHMSWLSFIYYLFLLNSRFVSEHGSSNLVNKADGNLQTDFRSSHSIQ